MRIRSTLLLGASLMLGGCFAAREARIESDYSYSGNFRRYRTYGFVAGDGLASDTSHMGEALREAIKTRMRVQGYRPARNRPDLLVSFRLFEGDLRFQGYNQEDMTRWVEKGTVEDEETPKDERQGYKPVRLLLTEGTLLITFIDHRTNRAVWNGYASGVAVPEGPRGMLVLRRSVGSIFDRYRIFTQAFREKQYAGDDEDEDDAGE